MKNFAQTLLMLACVLSVNCFAQSSNRMKETDTQMLSNMIAENDLAIVSYHVEERINMNFGGSITTYDVPDLSLVSTKELGENNVRIVTPKYAKVRAKTPSLAVSGDVKPKPSPAANISVKPVDKEVLTTTKRSPDYVNIDIIDTYERVMDKGFKSVVMLTKVADKHFFAGDLVLAAKWYNELFSATTDLDAVYYYRYAESLKAVNQLEKANEMMKIFESKSL